MFEPAWPFLSNKKYKIPGRLNATLSPTKGNEILFLHKGRTFLDVRCVYSQMATTILEKSAASIIVEVVLVSICQTMRHHIQVHCNLGTAVGCLLVIACVTGRCGCVVK
jgi:hypothetical protein